MVICSLFTQTRKQWMGFACPEGVAPKPPHLRNVSGTCGKRAELRKGLKQRSVFSMIHIVCCPFLLYILGAFMLSIKRAMYNSQHRPIAIVMGSELTAKSVVFKMGATKRGGKLEEKR